MSVLADARLPAPASDEYTTTRPSHGTASVTEFSREEAHPLPCLTTYCFTAAAGCVIAGGHDYLLSFLLFNEEGRCGTGARTAVLKYNMLDDDPSIVYSIFVVWTHTAAGGPHCGVR